MTTTPNNTIIDPKLDSLPYIDEPFTEQTRLAVGLVSEQQQTNNSSSKPQPPSPIQVITGMNNNITPKTPLEWSTAADHACIRLEYERLRERNTVLLEVMGKIKWERFLRTQSSMAESLETRLAKSKEQLNDLHEKRRISQITLGKQLETTRKDLVDVRKRVRLLQDALRERTNNNNNLSS
jgi:hypothetical protein